MSNILQEAYELYLHVVGNKSPNTVSSYKARLNVFLTYCTEHNLDLKDITPKVFNTFITDITTRIDIRTNKQYSSYTVADYAMAVKIFLKWTTTFEDYQGNIKPSHLSLYTIPKVEQQVKDTLTKEEISKLYTACKKEATTELVRRDTALLSLLLDTGLRVSELCELTLNHVHLDSEDAYILVSGKGRKQREIGLGQRARIDLYRYIRQYRRNATDNAVVFVSRTGLPMERNTLNQILYRLRDWANITSKQVSAHIFRHTFATMYLEQGGDVYMLSRLMGHTTVSTTELYLKGLKAKQARKGKSVLDNIK